MRIGAWALGAVLLLAVTPALGGAAAPAPALPQVTVRLDSVEPVDVNHDGDTVVVVNGTVNVTAPTFVEVGVALNVSVLSLYWPATVEPQRGNLTGSGDVPFTVTVSVPSRAAADVTATVQVVANVSAYGVGRDFTGDTTIPIVQFFGVALEPAVPLTSPATFDAPVGADTSFSFRLQNTGNGKDSFEVRVANAAELQNLGITTDLGSPITNVASGVKVVVTGSVHLPSTLALGDYRLDLEAFSTGAVSDGSQATASTQKTIHAVEAGPGPGPGGGGGGGGDGGNGTGDNGNGSPGPGAVEAVAAVGAFAVAAAAWRRVRRP